MEIWHRVASNAGETDFVAALDRMGVKYKVAPAPTPNAHGLVYFDMTETDARWKQIEAWIRKQGASNVFDTFFTPQEIRSAEWVRLYPVFEQGYPQPEEGWKQVTYENECPKCGGGYRQKAPFRLAGEPRMGKNDFLSLHWTYTVFCTQRVVLALQASHIEGHEVWPATIHRTDASSEVVSQLLFPHVAEPGLADDDKLRPETCSECGITKYAYHKRGYMRIKQQALSSDVDVQLTHEWFGSGGFGGFKEILISGRFAKLVLDQKWRGVRLKPVQLV